VDAARVLAATEAADAAEIAADAVAGAIVGNW
jgi:hypothetical protein